MNINELKIGDYVFYKGNNVTVKSIDGRWINIGTNKSITIDAINPIMLNGSILRLNGWKKDETINNCYNYDDLRMWKIPNDRRWALFKGNELIGVTLTVHLFQHIMYKVLGKEYDFKL